MTVRIGISGWRYAGWRGTFYPEGLPQRRELEYAAAHLPTIEINGTFYSLQRPHSFARWHDQTPRDFRFSVKGSRYITHLRRLRDVEQPLANFFAQGVLLLREKLGPILWQFPPRMTLDMALFDAFLSMLPRTTTQAARLARGHDPWLDGRAHTKTDSLRELRYAVEVRNDSFFTPDFIALLRRHGAALVVSDGAAKWRTFEDLTADFVYVRLHGSTQLYVSGYSPAELDRWARKIEAWSRGKDPRTNRHVATPIPAGSPRDVYVYFDNDAKVRAPADAAALLRRLHLAPARRRSA